MRSSPARPDATSPEAIGWTIEDVSFTYPRGNAPVVDRVSTAIEACRCTALLGPNGSGKSTLLRLLVRTLDPGAGEIRLGGLPLSSWSRGDLARAVGVVPQNEEVTFSISVRDLVAMGRYPHLGALRPFAARDHAAVEVALGRCDIGHLADRDFTTLSGGERQRARVARALAQEPRALVLDEPTLALDIRHEMEIFELVKSLSSAGVTVLLVTHNLNLAARYADTLILLSGGQVAAAGEPPTVLDRHRVEEVYGWPVQTSRFAGPGADTGAVQITPLSRASGEERAVFDKHPDKPDF